MSKKFQVGLALVIAVFVGLTAAATANPGLYILAGLALASAAGLSVFGPTSK